MPNIDNIKKYKNIHMIGIGGVSMSGIAEILLNFGFNITGSDASYSEITEILNRKGIDVTIGNDISKIASSDLVVYSAAIKQDDPEMLVAKRLNIPTIERADFLGELTRCYKDTIAISGTHGKTTTTSMVSLCFLEALKDPSIQVGAILKQLDGNYKVGNSEHFIIEACEYVESFLKFSPKAEIILNIDNKNFENIKNAFIKYVKLLPDDGLLVLNGDDSNCLDLKDYTNAKTVTYGITNKNTDFLAVNIVFDNDGFAEFDVYNKDGFYDIVNRNRSEVDYVINDVGEYNVKTIIENNKQEEEEKTEEVVKEAKANDNENFDFDSLFKSNTEEKEEIKIDEVKPEEKPAEAGKAEKADKE